MKNSALLKVNKIKINKKRDIKKYVKNYTF